VLEVIAPSRRAFGIALGLLVLTGVLVGTGSPAASASLVVGVTAGALVLVGRRSVLVGLLVTVLLVAPTRLVVLASIGDAQIRVGDVAIALLALAFLVRGRASGYRVPTAMLVFVGWCLLRGSSVAGVVTIAKMAEYLIGPFLLLRFSVSRETIWRYVAAYCVVATVTAPLFSIIGKRSQGLPGGPNELGLMGGCLIVLALSAGIARSRATTSLLLIIGATALLMSGSVSSILATGLGIAMIASSHSSRATVRRFVSAPVLMVAALALPLAVPAIRPDAAETLRAHRSQSSLFGESFRSVDPVIGGGWGQAERAPIDRPDVPLSGLHNTYLQLLVDVGLVGLVLFGLVVLSAFRRSPPESALILLLGGWLVSVTATPGAPWGLLGLTIVSATLKARSAGEKSRQGVEFPVSVRRA
jgi:hypothetical protein